MQCFVSCTNIYLGCSLICPLQDKLIFIVADPELNMILEDTIVKKLINMDAKQICLSVGQACPPINSGAKMSSKTSHTSSVVASLAPLVCEALHLSKHFSPGLASGRWKSSRSVFRKLRNKVYIRMFSGQSASKSLIKYKAKAEVLLEALKEELSEDEVECFKIRIAKTEFAVAAAGEIEAPIPFTSSNQSKVSTLSSDTTSTSLKTDTSCYQPKVSTMASVTPSLKGITTTVDIAMDAISEAMATILTMASIGEHSAMINSFREALDDMSANKEESSKVSSETMVDSG